MTPLKMLQAGERNFFPLIHQTWPEPFSGALYGRARARLVHGDSQLLQSDGILKSVESGRSGGSLFLF